MLKKYKLTLILASLVTLLPIPVQLLLGREFSAVLYTPLMLLGTFWFCVYFTLKDPNNKNQSDKPYKIVFWIIPVLSLFMNAMDYCFAKNLDLDMQKVLYLMLGAMFTVIGNYLPKVKQNSTLGIKLPWTYSSEENWNKTHRLGGKVWVGAGLLLMLSSLLPQEAAAWAMLVLILAAIMIPTIYSFRFYQKQKAEGAALMPMPILPGKSAKMSIVFLGLLAIFIFCVLFTGDIHYRFDEESFTVEASYYDDLTIHYNDIRGLEYRDGNVDGMRVWGFGSLRLLMGTFETDGVQYTRYTYYDPDSAVGLLVDGELVILSGKDPEQTRALYETLLSKCGTVG